MSIQQEARLVADRVDRTVGIDPATIFTIASILIPMLLKRFQLCQSTAQSTAQSAKEYLLDNYDPTTRTFDQSVIDLARPDTRRSARQAGERHLSRTQLDAMTVASFQHGLETSDDTVAQCSFEATNISDV